MRGFMPPSLIPDVLYSSKGEPSFHALKNEARNKENFRLLVQSVNEPAIWIVRRDIMLLAAVAEEKGMPAYINLEGLTTVLAHVESLTEAYYIQAYNSHPIREVPNFPAGVFLGLHSYRADTGCELVLPDTLPDPGFYIAAGIKQVIIVDESRYQADGARYAIPEMVQKQPALLSYINRLKQGKMSVLVRGPRTEPSTPTLTKKRAII